MQPLLSIIIPTLNEENFLPILLEDLVAQTEKNFEVHVIDGNSDDKTVEKATQYNDLLSITVSAVKKRNLSYQRNYGAKKSQSDFLLFLDADTRVNKHFVSDLLKEIKKEKHLIYLPTLLPQAHSYKYHVLFNFINFVVEVSQHWSKPLPTGAAMIFNKDFFNFIGGYKVLTAHDKKNFFPEDQDIVCRAKKTGVKAKFLHSVKVEFSLRRMENDGELKTLITYLTSALLIYTKGSVDKVGLKYEMGGHLYDEKKNNSDEIDPWMQDFIAKVKEAFHLK